MSKDVKETSRREFLKQVLRTAGYSVPVIVALNVSSRAAWAENYGSARGAQAGSDGKCDETVEKIFNPSCW